MIDIKKIRTNKDEVIALLNLRNKDFTSEINEIYRIDEEKRGIQTEYERLKALKNIKSKEFGIAKAQKKEFASIAVEIKEIDDKIKLLQVSQDDLESKILNLLYELPNIPLSDTFKGDESTNKVVRTWGEVRQFDFTPLAHWDLGEKHKLFDLERASKLSGSRFILFQGLGAKLERALINFMLDYHSKKGYVEFQTPFLVLPSTMFGTGQLPKFKDDMYHTDDDMYLISTAEITLTNIHAKEILNATDLPKKYMAYTPCFRKESGAAGKDTRGIIRVHQFDKVELVHITTPENSLAELEILLNDAEDILKQLELPYHVIRLSGGDLGFASAITYDIEVYLPSYNDYKEISSCSNYSDFQARRMETRYKKNKDDKATLVHTNNGSGLAIGRCLAAIIENYQNSDGSITVPKVLRPYLNGLEVIR